MSNTYGYVGKIARINLSTGEITTIPTEKYAADYIGGREICNRLFWKNVKPGTGAFDPENMLIYMTSPQQRAYPDRGQVGFYRHFPQQSA